MAQNIVTWLSGTEDAVFRGPPCAPFHKPLPRKRVPSAPALWVTPVGDVGRGAVPGHRCPSWRTITSMTWAGFGSRGGGVPGSAKLGNLPARQFGKPCEQPPSRRVGSRTELSGSELNPSQRRRGGAARTRRQRRRTRPRAKG